MALDTRGGDVPADLAHDHAAKEGTAHSQHSLPQEEQAEPSSLVKPGPEPLSFPYSIYSNSSRWTIVALASSISLFSALGANIFFPAIPTLADVFHKTIQDIKYADGFSWWGVWVVPDGIVLL